MSTPGRDVNERLKTNGTAFKIARETTDCSNWAVYPDPTDRHWVSKDAPSFFSSFMFIPFKSLLNKGMVEGLHFNLLIFHLYFPHWTLSKTANFGTGTGSVLLRVISVLLRVKKAKDQLYMYNGGQKCWDRSSDITKTSDPSLPPQTKLNLEQNGWKWVLFFATTLLGEVGGRRYKPKAEQKIVLGSRVLCNNCLGGLFTQSQALLSSIVWNWFRAIKWIFPHLSLQKYGKTFSLELLKCSFLVKCFLYAAADPSVALKSYGYLAKRGYSAWTFSLPKSK